MAVFISDHIMKNYDLSCPRCGSLNNIRIAGVYEAKRNPQHWLCCCKTCNKCYKPRKKKKEVITDMSIMNKARQALPIEVLGPLLAQEGRTQQSIADEYDIPYWAITELKKQYWPTGFNPVEYKGSENMPFENYPADKEITRARTDVEQKTNNEAATPTLKYTITEAYEQYEGAKADLSCINRIFSMIKKRSSGVDKLLSEHKALCEAKIVNLEQVFNQTFIEIPR